MARKKVNQERCLFCHEFPCQCDIESTNKMLRRQHQGGKPDDRSDDEAASEEEQPDA